ncbi:MAG TPA: TerC family protein [Bacteroidia bacterium]|jgi:predicted tellurium resistance membrane protein TerC|nr:TerC family protein [Bacteroidia bacterium]
MDWPALLSNLFSVEGLISLLTLSLLEIVLGIDNIIFIAIVADKLPSNQKGQARTTGLILAVFIRVALLFTLSYLSSNEDAMFHLGSYPITLRDVIFLAGGIFLLYKTCGEIWEKVNGLDSDHQPKVKKISVGSIILQIVLIDIVFSFDSILTAVVVSKNILIMSGAVIISMFIMVLSSGTVSEFINRNPRIKMLALSFLLMISLLLIAEATKVFTGLDIPKSYIYVALGFSLFTEMLNMWEKKRSGNKK